MVWFYKVVIMVVYMASPRVGANTVTTACVVVLLYTHYPVEKCYFIYILAISPCKIASLDECPLSDTTWFQT
jgi:hypothetical protein